MKKQLRARVLKSLAFIALSVHLALAALGQGSSPPAVTQLTPAWTADVPLGTTDPQQWRRAKPAFSYDGRCLATAGNGEARILDCKGHPLWKWNYGAINRFVVAGSLAVSPACDAVAIGGDSAYKFVWIASRNGRAVPVRFNSTPMGVAFDRTGESVAVGTGAGRMFLLHRDGREAWSTPRYSGGLPFDISFSPDNRLILVRDTAAILRVDGSVIYSFGGDRMSTSSDFQTIVTSFEPPHGPGPGNVSVWDQAGKQLFSNFSDDPGGVITPAGDKIMARVNEVQDPPSEGAYEPGDTILQLFSRDGTVLKELSGLDGRPVAVSPDGTPVLLETGRSLDAIDLAGKRLYSIAVNPNSYTIAPNFSAIVIFSWGSDATLEYFKLK